MEKGTREMHTAPDPTSTVPCPLRSREHIAMGRCVEYQRDNGCHCEHALVALRRTEKHLQSPTGLLTAYDTTARADALDGVRALVERAEAMEKARPQVAPVAAPQRPDARPPPVPFIRPTLAQTYREARGQSPPPEEVAAAVLAQREALASHCEIEGCKNLLRVNNLSGLCQEHRQKVTSRQRVELVAPVARAAGTAGNLLQRIETPAPPAKESIVARYEMGPCKHQGCTEQVATIRSKTGLCNKHRQVVYRVPAPAKAPPAPVKALPARKPAPAPIRSAPPADIISLLEHQLGHHEEQAEKCRKALQALR